MMTDWEDEEAELDDEAAETLLAEAALDDE